MNGSLEEALSALAARYEAAYALAGRLYARQDGQEDRV